MELDYRNIEWEESLKSLSNEEIREMYFSSGTNHLECYRIIQAFREAPEKMMDREDYEFYKNLPDEVTAYRGCEKEELEAGEGCPLGISWTLDYNIAESFAARSINGCVVKAIIPKSDIRCVHMGGKESEIITFLVDECEIVLDKIENYDFDKFHEIYG